MTNIKIFKPTVITIVPMIANGFYKAIWMNAKKAIELGFADEILMDEKRTAPVESYAFTGKTIEKALINKISAKAQHKPEPKAQGRRDDELKPRLSTIKNYL